MLYPSSILVSKETILGGFSATFLPVKPKGTCEWWFAVFAGYLALHISYRILAALFILMPMHKAAFPRTFRAVLAKPPLVTHLGNFVNLPGC